MAIVQESQYDGVTVRIHDDFFRNKTDEEIRQLLGRIAARAQLDLSSAAASPKQHKL